MAIQHQYKTALIFGHLWPEPSTTAAGQNMLSYITSLKKAHWSVHFWSPADHTEYSIQPHKIDIQTQRIEINSDEINAKLTELKPDIVIFDRFITEEQFAWRVAEYAPTALRILNCEDLHGLREARIQLAKAIGLDKIQTCLDIDKAENLKFLMNDKMLREVASIMRCDLTISLSFFEVELLRNRFKIDDSALLLLPFIRPNQQISLVDYSKRKNLIFLGNMHHLPNVLCCEYICQKIMPRLRKKIPDISINIYGAYATQRVLSLHNKKQGIYIQGHTENLWSVLSNARLLIAPIQAGAGVKGKLIDAMLCGTPSVTTSLGAEGIANDGWPGEICDDLDSFVNACQKLYSNANTWSLAAAKSQETLCKSGVSENNARLLINRINSMLEKINVLRSQNIMQSILMRQNLQASKYMSKWIIEKNANRQKSQE